MSHASCQPRAWLIFDVGQKRMRRLRKPNLCEAAHASMVSLWIGDIADSEQLMRYIDDEEGFAADFGCVLPSNSEFAFSDQAAPLSELLDGFTLSGQFFEEALSHETQRVMVRCVVVAFMCDYTLMGVRPSEKVLRFYRSVPFTPRP